MQIAIRLHDVNANCAPELQTMEQRAVKAKEEGFSCVHLAYGKVIKGVTFDNAALNEGLAKYTKRVFEGSELDVAVALIPLGVSGAAIATVISQAIAAIWCMSFITKKIPQLQLKREDWVVDRGLLTQTLKIGSLTALQQAAQPIGKVCIQSVINAQGIVAIDAFNAACKIDDYARIPTQSISNGIMTCTAQNRGAKQNERMEASFPKGLTIALIYFPIIFIVVQLIKWPAVGLLSPNGAEEIVVAGVSYLTIKAFTFVMPCLTNSIQGHFRGMGQMKIVLAGTVLQTAVRTICVFLWVPKIGINGEAYACFTGWMCQCLLQYTLYMYWRRKRAQASAAALTE